MGLFCSGSSCAGDPPVIFAMLSFCAILNGRNLIRKELAKATLRQTISPKTNVVFFTKYYRITRATASNSAAKMGIPQHRSQVGGALR